MSPLAAADHLVMHDNIYIYLQAYQIVINGIDSYNIGMCCYIFYLEVAFWNLSHEDII
jgi:hypothetical protein